MAGGVRSDYRGVLTYFVQAGKEGPIKIGRSKNPVKRMKTIQADSWLDCFLLGLSTEREKYLHERFKQHHIRGEWFSPSNEILEYISSLEPIEDALKRIS